MSVRHAKWPVVTSFVFEKVKISHLKRRKKKKHCCREVGCLFKWGMYLLLISISKIEPDGNTSKWGGGRNEEKRQNWTFLKRLTKIFFQADYGILNIKIWNLRMLSVFTYVEWFSHWALKKKVSSVLWSSGDVIDCILKCWFLWCIF